MVERFFGKLTDKAIRRGIFHGVPDLIAAIETYLAANNENPEPVVWTATADEILREGPPRTSRPSQSPTKTETQHRAEGGSGRHA